MFGAPEQAAIVALAGIIGEWGPRLTLTVLCDRSSPKGDPEVNRPDFSFRVAARLDRKRLGADFCVEGGSRSEAFSIRRLGGSRWRLRRTLVAMGFESTLGWKLLYR